MSTSQYESVHDAVTESLHFALRTDEFTKIIETTFREVKKEWLVEYLVFDSDGNKCVIGVIGPEAVNYANQIG